MLKWMRNIQVSDFINSFEQMQKDIQELKKGKK
jgi:hypothetical protein